MTKPYSPACKWASNAWNFRASVRVMLRFLGSYKIGLRAFARTVAGISAIAGGPALAQSLPAAKGGIISQIYADPSDIVLVLDGVGPCGSALFHIRRTSTNFQEFTALMYTAAALHHSVYIWVVSCDSDRNILSHGAAAF